MTIISNIQIRSHFSNWHNVGVEQATCYIKNRMSCIVHPSDPKARKKYIEKNYLRGISIDQLLSLDKTTLIPVPLRKEAET